MIIKITYRYPDDPVKTPKRTFTGKAFPEENGLGFYLVQPRSDKRELIMKEWILRFVETRK